MTDPVTSSAAGPEHSDNCVAATGDGIADFPSNRCPNCGQFLRKCSDGSYARHVVYDNYLGGWEWTC